MSKNAKNRRFLTIFGNPGKPSCGKCPKVKNATFSVSKLVTKSRFRRFPGDPRKIPENRRFWPFFGFFRHFCRFFVNFTKFYKIVINRYKRSKICNFCEKISQKFVTTNFSRAKIFVTQIFTKLFVKFL